MTRHWLRGTAFALVVTLAACSQVPDDVTPSETGLSPQFGGPAYDAGFAVATSPTAIYVGGRVGDTARLWRYNRDGSRVWETNLTESEAFLQAVLDITVDASQNVLVVKSHEEGGLSSLEKYTPSGKRLWRAYYDIPWEHDAPWIGVRVASVADGSIFVTGGSRYVNHAWVAKFSSGGQQLWVKRIAAEDIAAGEAGFNGFYATNGNVLTKYSGSGTLLWSREVAADVLGNVNHLGHSLSVNQSSIYVVGEKYFYGDDLDERDGFITKFDLNGTRRWHRTFGTPTYEYVSAVTVDSSGNAYLMGDTEGSLASANRGDRDVFIRKYGPSGTHVWSKQYGTPEGDSGRGIALISSTELYIAGSTGGDLGAGYQGGGDGFLMRTNGGGFQTWIR